MSKNGLRVQKSHSMMLSLYTLSILTLTVTVGFVAFLWFYPFIHGDLIFSKALTNLLLNSLYLTSLGLFLSLPVTFCLVYISVVWGGTRLNTVRKTMMGWVEQTPIILYGLVFVFLFGKSTLSLVLIFAFLGTSLLTVRWSSLSSRVRKIEIEAMQALGLTVWQLIDRLYFRRYFVDYLRHFVVVFCELLLVTTPVLLFANPQGVETSFLSLVALVSIFEHQESLESVILCLLVIHLIRFLLDRKTSYWEVEFG